MNQSQSNTARPYITIGIPCLNEEKHIEACVQAALGQDYPADSIEVLVADGGSTDRTRALLREMAHADPRLRVIDNPERIQAAGMNHIIRQARGQILARFDAHGEYSSDYIKNCVEVLQRTGADNVGGAQRARASQWFQRALCAALQSPLGVGGADYRSSKKEGYTDTVWLGAFRRRVFENVGLYDPGAITNEDAELNQRILDAGGSVYLSPSIVAYYYPRDSFRGLAKQYFRYGQGRARTLLKHGGFPKVRPLIPFLSVLAGAGLVATSAWHPLTAPAAGLYAAITGVEAIRVGRKLGLSAIPVVWAIFPVLHASHGVGFGVGLIQYLIHPDWNDPECLAPLDGTSSA